MGSLKLNRVPLVTQAFLVGLVAYVLHYATIPVPEDMGPVDQCIMRVIAMGVDMVGVLSTGIIEV